MKRSASDVPKSIHTVLHTDATKRSRTDNGNKPTAEDAASTDLLLSLSEDIIIEDDENSASGEAPARPRKRLRRKDQAASLSKLSFSMSSQSDDNNDNDDDDEEEEDDEEKSEPGPMDVSEEDDDDDMGSFIVSDFSSNESDDDDEGSDGSNNDDSNDASDAANDAPVKDTKRDKTRAALGALAKELGDEALWNDMLAEDAELKKKKKKQRRAKRNHGDADDDSMDITDQIDEAEFNSLRSSREKEWRMVMKKIIIKRVTALAREAKQNVHAAKRFKELNELYEKYSVETAVVKTGYGAELIGLLPTADNSNRPYYHQLVGLAWCLLREALPYKGVRGSILADEMGTGKCHGKNTPIIMWNGTTRMIQDVRVGELICGDDSTPRTVLSLARGREMMYRITPTKGDPYVVNESHILSFSISGNRKVFWSNTYSKYVVKWFSHDQRRILTRNLGTDEAPAQRFATSIVSPDYIDISVRDYLALNSSSRALLKGYRVGVFGWEEVPCPLDPYVLGIWLGDGTAKAAQVTNPDVEIISYLADWCVREGYTLNTNANVPIDHRISGGFLVKLKEMGLFGNKHVPLSYKRNSTRVRLEVLAGLIDTDGYLSTGCYDITQKSNQLAEDILFLARSCGLAAYSAKATKSWTYLGVKKEDVYNRITISGDIARIPVKVERRKAATRLQDKSVLVTNIDVERLGVDEYYGFALDGNHRYLLGDFTVTHNTLLMLLTTAMDYISGYHVPVRQLGSSQSTLAPTIVVCPNSLTTTWVNEVRKRFNPANMTAIALHEQYTPDWRTRLRVEQLVDYNVIIINYEGLRLLYRELRDELLQHIVSHPKQYKKYFTDADELDDDDEDAESGGGATDFSSFTDESGHVVPERVQRALNAARNKGVFAPNLVGGLGRHHVSEMLDTEAQNRTKNGANEENNDDDDNADMKLHANGSNTTGDKQATDAMTRARRLIRRDLSVGFRTIWRDPRQWKTKHLLFGMNFRRCILDESTTFKNANTLVAEAVRAVHAVIRWGCSGTPLENNIDELYSLLRVLGYDNSMHSIRDVQRWHQLVANNSGEPRAENLTAEGLPPPAPAAPAQRFVLSEETLSRLKRRILNVAQMRREIHNVNGVNPLKAYLVRAYGSTCAKSEETAENHKNWNTFVTARQQSKMDRATARSNDRHHGNMSVINTATRQRAFSASSARRAAPVTMSARETVENMTRFEETGASGQSRRVSSLFDTLDEGGIGTIGIDPVLRVAEEQHKQRTQATSWYPRSTAKRATKSDGDDDDDDDDDYDDYSPQQVASAMSEYNASWWRKPLSELTRERLRVSDTSSAMKRRAPQKKPVKPAKKTEFNYYEDEEDGDGGGDAAAADMCESDENSGYDTMGDAGMSERRRVQQTVAKAPEGFYWYTSQREFVTAVELVDHWMRQGFGLGLIDLSEGTDAVRNWMMAEKLPMPSTKDHYAAIENSIYKTINQRIEPAQPITTTQLRFKVLRGLQIPKPVVFVADMHDLEKGVYEDVLQLAHEVGASDSAPGHLSQQSVAFRCITQLRATCADYRSPRRAIGYFERARHIVWDVDKKEPNELVDIKQLLDQELDEANEFKIETGQTDGSVASVNQSLEQVAKEIATEAKKIKTKVVQAFFPMRIATKFLMVARVIEASPPNERHIIGSDLVRFFPNLERFLTARGHRVATITGSMNKSKRDDIIALFTSGHAGAPTILLASLRCVAMGLNLQIANNIHVLLGWWNGALEEQFKRRIARAGQELEVHFYYYVLRDTIEELVIVRGGEKSNMITSVIGGNDGVITTGSNFSRPDITNAYLMTFEQGPYGPTPPPPRGWPEKTPADFDKLPKVALGARFAGISVQAITSERGFIDNAKLARALVQDVRKEIV